MNGICLIPNAYMKHSHTWAMGVRCVFLLRFSAIRDRNGKATIKRTRRRKLAETIKNCGEKYENISCVRYVLCGSQSIWIARWLGGKKPLRLELLFTSANIFSLKIHVNNLTKSECSRKSVRLLRSRWLLRADCFSLGFFLYFWIGSGRPATDVVTSILGRRAITMHTNNRFVNRGEKMQFIMHYALMLFTTLFLLCAHHS